MPFELRYLKTPGGLSKLQYRDHPCNYWCDVQIVFDGPSPPPTHPLSDVQKGFLKDALISKYYEARGSFYRGSHRKGFADDLNKVLIANGVETVDFDL